MAQYGYSTGYQGGGPSPVPSGYIEAYGNAGRAIGSGIASIGQDIGNTLREYAKNKAEDQYATAKIESLISQYIKPGEQGPTQGGATADLEAVGQIVGEKNLKAFVEGKANRMQKLAIAHSLETYGVQEHQRQQNELLATQVEKAKEDVRQQKALKEATRNILGIPTNVSGTATTYGLQYPEPATFTETPSAPVVPPKYDSVQQAPPDLEALMQAEQARRQAPAVPGLPTIAPQNFGLAALTPKPIKLDAVPPQPVATVEAKPVTKTVETQGPPEKVVTGTQTTVQQVPWEEFRGRITQELARQGLPVTPEAVDQLARLTGYQPPIQAQTLGLPGVGTAVQLDGKTHFVPVNLAQQQHILASSVNQDGFQGTFRTTKEAEEFRKDLATYNDIQQSVGKLDSIMKQYPGVSGQVVRSLSPTVSGEISSELSALKRHLNKAITGGGNLSETDYKRIDAVIADPSKFFQFDSGTRKRLLGLEDVARRNLENTFKASAMPGSTINSKAPAAYNSGAVKSLSYDPVSGKLK